MKRQGWCILLLWELEVVLDCDRTCQRIPFMKVGNLHTLKITSWLIMKERKAKRITRSFLHISKFAHYCSYSLSATLRMTAALVRPKLLRVFNSVQAAASQRTRAHCLFQHLPFHVSWNKLTLLCIMAPWDVKRNYNSYSEYHVSAGM